MGKKILRTCQLGLGVFLLIASMATLAGIDATLWRVIEVVAENDIPNDYEDAALGEKICRAGNGSMCSYVSSVGEGICRAKQGSGCSYKSLSDALSMPVKDTEWKWDEFRTPNATGRIWACRGTATGQFADDYNCASQLKYDNTWPNN